MATADFPCPRCGSPCASDSQTPNQYTCSHCDIIFTFRTSASGRTSIQTQTILAGDRVEAKPCPIVQSGALWNAMSVRAPVRGKPISVYERVQTELQGKSREELLKRLRKLWDFLEKDKTSVEKIYGRALPNHFLKYYHVSLKCSCTYKEFLLGWFDDLSRDTTDGQLITIIAQIESDLSINTDREITSAFAQSHKQFKGRQKGRAYKSFQEHS